MAPPSGAMVRGRLYCEIDRQFGGLDRFKTLFKAQALEVFGSGYAWLVQEGGRLKITTTPNQDTPLARGQYPLLTIDVWEHAYYLKHYNQRARLYRRLVRGGRLEPCGTAVGKPPPARIEQKTGP